MARGWESKAVEEQQAARDASGPAPGPQLSPGETADAQRIASLHLARARVLADLQNACRAPHRAMLEAALADLETQIRSATSRG